MGKKKKKEQIKNEDIEIDIMDRIDQEMVEAIDKLLDIPEAEWRNFAVDSLMDHNAGSMMGYCRINYWDRYLRLKNIESDDAKKEIYVNRVTEYEYFKADYRQNPNKYKEEIYTRHPLWSVSVYSDNPDDLLFSKTKMQDGFEDFIWLDNMLKAGRQAEVEDYFYNKSVDSSLSTEQRAIVDKVHQLWREMNQYRVKKEDDMNTETIQEATVVSSEENQVKRALKSEEEYYGATVSDMDDETFKRFAEYMVATNKFDEARGYLKEDDPRIDDETNKSIQARRWRYIQSLLEVGNNDYIAIWNRVAVERPDSGLEYIEPDDDDDEFPFKTIVQKIPETEEEKKVFNDLYYGNPTLDYPDPTANRKEEYTVELTPAARAEYIDHTHNDFTNIHSGQFGVKGKTFADDPEGFKAEVKRIAEDESIKPMNRERLKYIMQAVSDGDIYDRLTDEQIKALFYLPKHARWFQRNSQNTYKTDMLADGYTDENGLVERKDKKSVRDWEDLRKEHLSIMADLQAKLALSVDSLHVKLIALAEFLTPDELIHLSNIFKVAGIEYQELAAIPEGFAPELHENIISELYEILGNMDENIIPGVSVAKEVVFYLDLHINTNDKDNRSTTPEIYKALVDLAYAGFINSSMTEYPYTAAALSMAIEYFEAHPIYTYVDKVTNETVTINMLERIEAGYRYKVDPLRTECKITEYQDQIIQEIGGNNEMGVQIANGNATQALAASSNQFSTSVAAPTPNASNANPNDFNPWGNDRQDTNPVGSNMISGKAVPKPIMVNPDGSHAFNLFPKNQEMIDLQRRAALVGDKRFIPAVAGYQTENQQPVQTMGKASAYPRAVYEDPQIGADESIGCQYLWGLPPFQLNEEFYYISDTEVAVKYADGRIFIVRSQYLYLIQEIWSMERNARIEQLKRNGQFPRPSEFGSTDRLDMGIWNNFPAHVRYRMHPEHDNVWRVEFVPGETGDMTGGVNIMGKVMNGYNQVSGTSANGINYNTAAQALVAATQGGNNMNNTAIPNMTATPTAGYIPNPVVDQNQINQAYNNGYQAAQAQSQMMIAQLNAQIAQLQAQVAQLQNQVNAARMSAPVQTPAFGTAQVQPAGYNNPFVNSQFGAVNPAMNAANPYVQQLNTTPALNYSASVQPLTANNFGYNQGFNQSVWTPAQQTPAFNFNTTPQVNVGTTAGLNPYGAAMNNTYGPSLVGQANFNTVAPQVPNNNYMAMNTGYTATSTPQFANTITYPASGYAATNPNGYVPQTSNLVQNPFALMAQGVNLMQNGVPQAYNPNNNSFTVSAAMPNFGLQGAGTIPAAPVNNYAAMNNSWMAYAPQQNNGGRRVPM